MINSLLNSIQRVITLSPAEIDTVTSLFKEKTYKKGDFFLEEGRICKQVGFVAKGLMRFYINQEGEEKIYDFSQENEFVCNYESFLSQIPSSKNIQALEDSIVFLISHADLQLFYTNVRGGERFGRIAIEAVFVKLLQDISSLYTETRTSLRAVFKKPRRSAAKDLPVPYRLICRGKTAITKPHP